MSCWSRAAGTGMLAVMAECALGKDAAGRLHLNEIAAIRAGLLAGLFPGTAVTRHNAEALADFLPGVRPTVVLMNPPFSATPGIERIRHDADLRHIRSAFSMLPPGGRLAAITSAHYVPGDAAWRGAFAGHAARTVFTMAVDGRAYARRGTGFDTRLTVIERSARPGIDIDGQARAATPAALLDAVIAQVPPRRRNRARAGPARARRHRPGPVRQCDRAAEDREAGRPRRPEDASRLGSRQRARRRDGGDGGRSRAHPPPRPPPAPTSPGARASCGCRAPSSTRPRSCSPARWPPCPIRCRPTAPSCPSAW